MLLIIQIKCQSSHKPDVNPNGLTYVNVGRLTMVPIDDVQHVAFLVMALVAFARGSNVSIALSWRYAYASALDRMHLDSVTIGVGVSDAYCHHYVSRASMIDSSRMMGSMIRSYRAYNVELDERTVIEVIVMCEWWMMAQCHINYDVDCQSVSVVLAGNVIRVLNFLIYMIPRMRSQFHGGHQDSMYCRRMFCAGLVCGVVYALNQHNSNDCSRHAHRIEFVLKLDQKIAIKLRFLIDEIT